MGSHLSILGPEQLRLEFNTSQGIVPNNLANFGYIPYGSYLLGRVYYFDGRQGGSGSGGENPNGCEEFGSYSKLGDPDDEFTPIFLVHR